MKRLFFSLVLLLATGACKVVPDYSTALPTNAPALIPLGRKEPVPDFSRQWEDRDELLDGLEQSLRWLRREHAKQFLSLIHI